MKIQLFCLTIEGFLNGRKKEVYKDVWKGLNVQKELGNDVIMGKEANYVKVQNYNYREEEEYVD